MSETPEEVVGQFMAAVTKGDLESAAALLAPDVTYDDLGVGQTFHGAEEARAFIGAVLSALPDFAWTPLRMISSGGLVATEWRMTGTQTGEFPGLPATGNYADCLGFSFTDVADDLIVNHRDCFNMVSYLQQVGLMPAPEAV